jgi:5'-3' exonuclease
MAKTFTSLGAKAPKDRVLVIDALNLGFRWKHQGRTDFREDYMRTVESFATSYNCGTIIITADKGSSTYRKEVYPEYKSNRKVKYEKQTEEERQAFADFIKEFDATLKLMNKKWLVLQYDGVEADDLAAYIVRNLDDYNVSHMWLVSSDRDWDLLISEKVSRFSYINRKETTFENWQDTHNYSIEDYITIKCLMGDSGDGISGIPQIGPKRAEQLAEQYGSAFDIYDTLPIDSKYKYIQSLNESGDVLLRNYEIMDLLAYCDEAIGAANTNDIDNLLSSHI